eukprot:3702638-Prymnesium_polylepis.1
MGVGGIISLSMKPDCFAEPLSVREKPCLQLMAPRSPSSLKRLRDKRPKRRHCLRAKAEIASAIARTKRMMITSELSCESSSEVASAAIVAPASMKLAGGGGTGCEISTAGGGGIVIQGVLPALGEGDFGGGGERGCGALDGRGGGPGKSLAEVETLTVINSTMGVCSTTTGAPARKAVALVGPAR